jgi:hypothetical protein
MHPNLLSDDLIDRVDVLDGSCQKFDPVNPAPQPLDLQNTTGWRVSEALAIMAAEQETSKVAAP